MAKANIIERQLLIIEFLRQSPRNFEQIRESLIRNEDRSGYQLDISQRTFQRDCQDIFSLWGIEIVYNKKQGEYQINQEQQSELLNRALDSYHIIGALRKKEKIGKSIFLENRKPTGAQYFNGILHAIENNLIITFDHNSYWKDSSERTCIAKAIKESQNRFYLIAYDLDKKDFRNFGLDRISNLNITSKSKSSPRIDIDKYYQHAFGIECYNEPTKVILEIDLQQRQYIESLPLHKSQKIVCVGEQSFLLELFVHPTHELVLEILKHGSNCKVIEPESLKEQVMDNVAQLYEMYFNAK